MALTWEVGPSGLIAVVSRHGDLLLWVRPLLHRHKRAPGVRVDQVPHVLVWKYRVQYRKRRTDLGMWRTLDRGARPWWLRRVGPGRHQGRNEGDDRPWNDDDPCR